MDEKNATDGLLEILKSDDAEAVLLLIPLALVAWADGNADMKELWAIATHHARKSCSGKTLCLSEDGYRFFYDTFVYRKPDSTLADYALDLLEGHLERLSTEKADAFRQLIFDMCNDVAKSSGGVFGLHKVSGREKQVVAALRSHLRDRAAQE